MRFIYAKNSSSNSSKCVLRMSIIKKIDLKLKLKIDNEFIEINIDENSKGDLLEALNGFSNATANLRQLFGAKNKGGDAGNNH